MAVELDKLSAYYRKKHNNARAKLYRALAEEERAIGGPETILPASVTTEVAPVSEVYAKQAMPTTFTHEGVDLPINKEAIEDSAYTRSLLKTILPLGLLVGDKQELLTRTRNCLGRAFERFSKNEDGSLRPTWEVSVAELIRLEDNELLGVRNLGLTGLQLFRRATKRITEGLYTNQPSAQK